MKPIVNIIITLIKYYLIGLLLSVLIIGTITTVEVVLYNQYAMPNHYDVTRAVFVSAFPLSCFYYLVELSVKKSK